MAAARLDGSLANAQRCSQTPAAAACKTLWAARGTALEPCPLTCVLRRKAAIGTELARGAFAQVSLQEWILLVPAGAIGGKGNQGHMRLR